MIARISGILIQKSVTHCVVDVHGTGYRIIVPLSTFYELPKEDQPVVLHVHTHVREDAISLYGFHTREEREVFQMMISVSGIGPKLAVNILSGIAAGELVRAVTEEDLKRLTGIPGMGKKTAERMILELKDKAAKLGRDDVTVCTVAVKTGDQVKEDALSALVNLGYKGSAVKDVVDRIMREAPETPSLDQLLKQALRTLAG
ncbi:MAG: Holliday junction DNA helicase RuvA [Deltaproteobacteria bacterium RBG_16_58_17]|nr:MAG: Holliday junction DNA helicase RuvA [Deltaproteobacteria bacterium RBG_16_58_17]OHE16759.1 MAG: Holliday junction DNA helicase RuvA [Syntrophobacterales bacterium GWC2_56_13]OHE20940.1 MAG: Holliday junction DNA helicase RuvA [Syntrophobacterales bacterium GWF2_56_9]